MGTSNSFIPFKDRCDVGRRLADALSYLAGRSCAVLALPCGGVPVAFEISRALAVPLDVLLVRKIGLPWNPEIGLGAVVEGNPPQSIFNEDLTARFSPSKAYLDAEESRQREELQRRRRQYGNRPRPVLGDQTVIVVDDGIATGGTMEAALTALALEGFNRLVLAVPVAPRAVLNRLCTKVEDCVCLHEADEFRAVSLYYDEFRQTTDEEVIGLLDAAAPGHPVSSGMAGR